MATPIDAYLRRHAEPERALADTLDRRFGHVVTIPAYGEGEELFEALESIPPGREGPVLVIVTVNARADSPAWVHRANRETLGRLRDASALALEGTLLLVDRSIDATPLPARQGVGLARKIGADIALAAIARDGVTSAWIHCTDADAIVPPDYFDQVEGRSADRGALVYRFRHADGPDPRLGRAALEYELAIRYYVAGLAHAGSPYAFDAVGSTLALHAETYASVRGFPRRLAAEDFYILDKIAQQASVTPLRGQPLQLSSRTSERTPFGTGPTLTRRNEARFEDTQQAPDPSAFAHLAAWLSALEAWGARGAAGPLPDLLAESAGRRGVDPERLLSSLEAVGSLAAASRAARGSSVPGPLTRRLHGSFHGGRTLRLIHALRDRGLADLPLLEALDRAPFVGWRAGDPLESARESLEAAWR